MRSARSLKEQARPAVADKREAILRAATKVFAENGYFNSKVADIARVAGVADGTVYLYFKSKEDILHTIFDRNAGDGIREGRHALAEITHLRETIWPTSAQHPERLGPYRDL